MIYKKNKKNCKIFTVAIILGCFFFGGLDGFNGSSFFPEIRVALAATTSYTVTFSASLDGFAYVNESCSGGATCTQGFTAADGNPAGSVYAKVVGKNKKNLGYFSKSLTWETMGVPAGAIVTQVDGKFDVKLAQETHAATQSVGLKIYDALDSVSIFSDNGDLETEFDPTSANWTTKNVDGAKSVSSSYGNSATALTIRMRSDVNSGNNNSASTEVRMDNLVFTITYNMPPELSISQPDGIGDVVSAGDPFNITYSLSDEDNVVTTAFYYDEDNSGLDGTAIPGECATAIEGSSVMCSWDTTSIPSGAYYIYGITNDGVSPQVSAYSTGTITIQGGGALSVDIVDSGGNSVANPSAYFEALTFDWNAQQSSGVFGASSQKIRLNNTIGTSSWTLSISATSGPTALWQGSSYTYDYNGTASAGRLRIDASASTITPQSGCSNTGLSKGSATYFVQGSQDSINLVTAGGSAQTNCYWDITGVGLLQDIPVSQQADVYSIDMTLTAV